MPCSRPQNQRTDLRQVHEEMERQLTARLAQYRAAHDWMDLDERRARDVLFKRFVHSIYEVRALRRERGELAERIADFDALGEQLQRLQIDFEVRSRAFTVQGRAFTAQGRALRRNRPSHFACTRFRLQIPRVLGARTSIGTVHFEPLALEEAGAIMVDSHAQALSFFAAMKRRAAGAQPVEGDADVADPEDASETGKTMGWTQMQRITRDGRVQFNFTKRIETVGVDELVAKSWAMYCDFTLYHGIYASVQKLEILQRINDNTLLIRRDLQDGPGEPVFRTVFLLFRIKIDGGFLICFRSHNPRVVVEDDDDASVQWMDMFYWLMITEPDDGRPSAAAGPKRAPGRGCDVTYGGNVLNHRSARYAMRWKYQIAMALLRWESNTAAPLFAFYG
jgi:hypothetical protein